MRTLPITDSQTLPAALAALRSGQLVIYPTETCYGLGASANNPKAISKLLAYKGNRRRQVSVAVSSQTMARRYVKLNSIAVNLYHEFLPGPITVISQSRQLVDPRLESATGTLGVRYPAHPFALRLIRQFGRPLTATSANTTGKKEPYSLADWHKYTSSRKQTQIALFLDAGPLRRRPTSTVVDTTLNDPLILRQGELNLPSLSQHSFISHSPRETRNFAATLISRFLSLTRTTPLILALQGELGSGKTQFTKGIAQALGIKKNIASPTYLLMREYSYTLPKYSGILYHLDTWRLTDLSELDSTLHLNQLLRPNTIFAIEWAGKAKTWLKSHGQQYSILIINLKELDPSTRKIEYTFTNPQWS